jgi:hypothetical protein
MVEFGDLKTVFILLTLIASSVLVRHFKQVPCITLTLLCLIALQTNMNSWYDFLFILGIGFILIGINIEYVKLFNKLKELENKGKK